MKFLSLTARQMLLVLVLGLVLWPAYSGGKQTSTQTIVLTTIGLFWVCITFLAQRRRNTSGA